MGYAVILASSKIEMEPVMHVATLKEQTAALLRYMSYHITCASSLKSHTPVSWFARETHGLSIIPPATGSSQKSHGKRKNFDLIKKF